MNDLLDALFHAAVYALVAGAMVVLAFYVLDLLTPGHLGRHLLGSDGEASYSAAVVTSAWLLGTGVVLFTAIWTNGESSLGTALLWTVVFGLLGIVLNVLMLLAIDAVTPGNLRAIACTPGRAVPLAWVSAATAITVSGLVAASIA